MEKIVIGVPHEVKIRTSINLDVFDVELCLESKGFNYHIPLPKIADHTFSILVPKTLKYLEGETVPYSLYVYKDNARFRSDHGKVKLISEKDFEVLGKKGKKIVKTSTELKLPAKAKKEADQVALDEDLFETVVDETPETIVDETPETIVDETPEISKEEMNERAQLILKEHRKKRGASPWNKAAPHRRLASMIKRS